ncbi:uncharacterized protein V1518DRAFT_147679 [Limtongia smithiae]|uniref:uncharacterized protein n=1 Tax=Limtongia smithiae TaxID=1125753 RepID=UPI0034CFE6F6
MAAHRQIYNSPAVIDRERHFTPTCGLLGLSSIFRGKRRLPLREFYAAHQPVLGIDTGSRAKRILNRIWSHRQRGDTQTESPIALSTLQNGKIVDGSPSVTSSSLAPGRESSCRSAKQVIAASCTTTSRERRRTTSADSRLCFVTGESYDDYEAWLMRSPLSPRPPRKGFLYFGPLDTPHIANSPSPLTSRSTFKDLTENTAPAPGSPKKQRRPTKRTRLAPRVTEGDAQNEVLFGPLDDREPDLQHNIEPLSPQPDCNCTQSAGNETEYYEACSNDEANDKSTTCSGAPVPPPLPLFFLSQNRDASECLNQQVTGNIPPPPPPPPPPMFLSGTKASLPANINVKEADSPKCSPSLRLQIPIFDKEPISTPRKMKTLHWDKLHAVDNTIWSPCPVFEKAQVFEVCDTDLSRNIDDRRACLEETLYKDGVFNEVERVFAIREARALKTPVKGNDVGKNIIPRDMAQQFEINLHTYAHLSEDELISKVLRCDNDIIRNTSLLQFLTKDDITKIAKSISRDMLPYSTNWSDPKRKPTEDASALSRPDRIFLELCFNLQPYWQTRMQLLLFAQNFENDYHDLMSKLRLLQAACEETIASGKLQEIFHIILMIGNFMNGPSQNVAGFKLSTLRRLSYVKDASNRTSFLHFIEKTIRVSFTHLNEFTSELKGIEAASKLSIDQLGHDCRKFEAATKDIQQTIDQWTSSTPPILHPNDRVVEILEPVRSKADECRVDLLTQFERTRVSFESALQHFGEDRKDKTCRDCVLVVLAEFVREYERVRIDNLQREEEAQIASAEEAIVVTVAETADLKLQGDLVGLGVKAHPGDTSTTDATLEA